MERTELDLTQEDFTIRKIDIEECEECEDPATHELWVEIRSLGQSFMSGRFCETCARTALASARFDFPAASPEGATP